MSQCAPQATQAMPQYDEPEQPTFSSTQLLGLIIILVLFGVTIFVELLGNVDNGWVAWIFSALGVASYTIGSCMSWRGWIYRAAGWILVFVSLGWLLWVGENDNKTSSGSGYRNNQTTNFVPQPGINYRSPLTPDDGSSVIEPSAPPVTAAPEPEDIVPTSTEEPVPTTVAPVTTVTTVAPPEEESEEPIPPVEDEPVVPDIPAEPNDPVDQEESTDQPEVSTYDPNQSNGNGQIVQPPG